MPLRCWLGHALRNTMDDLAHTPGADTQTDLWTPTPASRADALPLTVAAITS